MNYRHAFHAGNFADVFKHAILVRVLMHLRGKTAAFRVIDTHAGAGRYDLAGPEASRGGEWCDGIGRFFLDVPKDEAAGALLRPYRKAIAARNADGMLRVYPGSPLIAQAFLRENDRLVACELEPGAAAALARNLQGDRRCKAVVIDGWTALNAYVPPKERRGVVLIDPAFEDADEFSRLACALEAAYRKWATGIYLAWYPIKERDGPDRLARELRRSGIPGLLRSEIAMSPTQRGQRLAACGVIIVNPTWNLEHGIGVMLPELVAALAPKNRDGRGGTCRLDWLARER
jgi:23S rRNA (adenine2030-N6)-methyltransferase